MSEKGSIYKPKNKVNLLDKYEKPILAFSGCLLFIFVVFTALIVNINQRSKYRSEMEGKLSESIEAILDSSTVEELDKAFLNAQLVTEEIENSDRLLIEDEDIESVLKKFDELIEIREEVYLRVKSLDFIKKWISSDGRFYDLENNIKKTYRGARSYEHIETEYNIDDKTSRVFVVITFRSDNVEGKLISNTYRVEMDLEGNVLNEEFTEL